MTLFTANSEGRCAGAGDGVQLPEQDGGGQTQSSSLYRAGESEAEMFFLKKPILDANVFTLATPGDGCFRKLLLSEADKHVLSNPCVCSSTMFIGRTV